LVVFLVSAEPIKRGLPTQQRKQLYHARQQEKNGVWDTPELAASYRGNKLSLLPNYKWLFTDLARWDES
jgi:hypothetical protein